jgi:hypothetical protein
VSRYSCFCESKVYELKYYFHKLIMKNIVLIEGEETCDIFTFPLLIEFVASHA